MILIVPLVLLIILLILLRILWRRSFLAEGEALGLKVLKRLARKNGVWELHSLMASMREDGENVFEAVKNLRRHGYLTAKLIYPTELSLSKPLAMLKLTVSGENAARGDTKVKYE
jgi:hypothetical protein